MTVCQVTEDSRQTYTVSSGWNHRQLGAVVLLLVG